LSFVDLNAALVQDGCFAADGVSGVSTTDLIRIALLNMSQPCRCHKQTFGPFLQVDARWQWIDDSASDQFNVLCELENAEKLFRYAISRGIVDHATGVISSARLKDLKNYPCTVKRFNAVQLAEFHRQERERFEHVTEPFTYRVGSIVSTVAPQRGKMASKVARKHAMLVRILSCLRGSCVFGVSDVLFSFNILAG
jgi:hypothetical protein